MLMERIELECKKLTLWGYRRNRWFIDLRRRKKLMAWIDKYSLVIILEFRSKSNWMWF